MKQPFWFEYGGGLGDVLMQMYDDRSYNVLQEMSADQEAKVVLCCHNPYAAELFEHHPRRQQIRLLELPYHAPEHANPIRSAHGLCKLEDRPPNPRSAACGAPIVFFPPAEELVWLEDLGRQPYIVLSASAGERSRSLPAHVLRVIAEHLATQTVRVLAVGRNYARGDRFEVPVPEAPNFVNLLDKLTVPGVAWLVQRCLGTVNCHSAIGMLGWLERKPQLLLIDEVAWTRHFKKKDQWAFGADFATTTWTRFDEFHLAYLKRFLAVALPND